MTFVTSDSPIAAGYPKKRARTRRQLMNAGMTVLAQKGPDGATVGEIAREARVATGTFYNHFPSINDLVEAVTNELTTGVQIGRETLDQIENDPAVRVLVGTGQLLDLAQDDPESARAFVSLLATVPHFRDRVRSIIGGAIADGVTAGRFAERDVDFTVDALLGSVVQWMRTTLSDEANEQGARSDQFRIALSIVGVPARAHGPLLRRVV